MKLPENAEVFAHDVAKSPANIAKTQAQAATAELLAAAGSAERLVHELQTQWAAQGFTPQQCIFALALTTINFRDNFPVQLGGKAFFDQVAGEARQYYDANVEP